MRCTGRRSRRRALARAIAIATKRLHTKGSYTKGLYTKQLSTRQLHTNQLYTEKLQRLRAEQWYANRLYTRRGQTRHFAKRLRSRHAQLHNRFAKAPRRRNFENMPCPIGRGGMGKGLPIACFVARAGTWGLLVAPCRDAPGPSSTWSRCRRRPPPSPCRRCGGGCLAESSSTACGSHLQIPSRGRAWRKSPTASPPACSRDI